MSQRIDALLGYYARDEIDECSIPTEPMFNTVPATAMHTITYLPFPPQVIVLPEQPVRQEPKATSTRGDSSKEDDQERSWVAGTALGAAAATMQYRMMHTWVKYRRVCRDQGECRRIAHEDPVGAELAFHAYDHLSTYRTNRAWSLFNYSMLLGGAAMGAVACVGPKKSLALPALALGGFALLSGATRCGLWYSQVHERKLRTLALQTQAKTQVIARSFPEPSAPPPEYSE